MNLVNVSYTPFNGVSSGDAPIPAATAGNLIVALIACFTDPSAAKTVVSIVGNAGTVFVAAPGTLSNNTNNATAVRTFSQIWYGIAVGADTSLHVIFNNSAGSVDFGTMEYQPNAGKTFQFDVGSANQNVNMVAGSLLGPPIVVSVPNSLIVGLGCCEITVYGSISAPFVFLSGMFSGSFDGEGAAHLLNATPATYQATWGDTGGVSDDTTSTSFVVFRSTSVAPLPVANAHPANRIETHETDIFVHGSAVISTSKTRSSVIH